MIHALFEFTLTLLCLAIVYRSNPRTKRANAIWVLLCISCAANTLTTILGHSPLHSLTFEHYAIAVGITFKFFSMRGVTHA